MRLMNAFGDRAAHTVLSAVPEAMGARDAIDPAISVAFPADAAPALHGKPGLRRYRALSDYMKGFDLVLTYNWGAMDAVAARRVFTDGCPPIIHHEDGFNADEAVRLNWKRNAFRQVMLGAARDVVVPSRTLEWIAGKYWGRSNVVRIPNGIATARYSARPSENAIPGLTRKAGDIVVGTLAGLRPVKNLTRLVRAVAPLPNHVKLVIVGEGPEEGAIRAEAARLKMADRLLMPGFLSAPERYVGLFDIFSLSSDSEQFPISLVEAMAAGLPAAATSVGDVAEIVAEANRPFVTKLGDEAAFSDAIGRLASDAALRQSVGAMNQKRARAEYDEAAMIARYSALYGIGG